MKEDYNIQIGFKCPLKLSNPPDFFDGKRFCEFCSKNVYDLRNLSEKKIHELAKGEESICGRIQVERISNPNINHTGFLRKFMMGFAVFAFINSAFSQKKNSDTLRVKEIEGMVMVSFKPDENNDNYYSPKSRLIGGFKVGEKYLENTKILKLNQSSITEGEINYNGEIDFSIDEYLAKKENIILFNTEKPDIYRYKIVKKEQFDNRIYESINENDVIYAELPKKYSNQSLYFIDGEEVDYEEFSETVNTNTKDYFYFFLNPDLATIWLEEKNRKSVYVAYSR